MRSIFLIFWNPQSTILAIIVSHLNWCTILKESPPWGCVAKWLFKRMSSRINSLTYYRHFQIVHTVLFKIFDISLLTRLAHNRTINFYPMPYYSNEIWNIPSLKVNLKQNLLAASSYAQKISDNGESIRVSLCNTKEQPPLAPLFSKTMPRV